MALLIEDKVTAAAGHRQAERYAAHAARMRDDGWDVRTLLLAPAGYVGERASYDGHVALEVVATLLVSHDDGRLEHRRGVIERAIAKRGASGVQIADLRLHALKAAYDAHVAALVADGTCAYGFPALRDEYYGGSSWIDPITHPDLPTGHVLRYRLWTNVKDRCGRVDLIAARPDEATRALFEGIDLPGATVAPYSKGRGILVGIAVPEMRQADGFDVAVADEALAAMDRLVAWRTAEG